LTDAPDIAFSPLELAAQMSLRQREQWISDHPRLCSQGRTLMASVGGSLDSEHTAHLLEEFHRVLLIGQPTDVATVAGALAAQDYDVDADMTWISAPSSAAARCLSLLGAVNTEWGPPARMNASASAATVASMQQLHRSCGLVPLPGYFLKDESRLVTTYFSDRDGVVIGSSSCLSLACDTPFPRPTVLFQGTCVRPEFRRSGVARALKIAAVHEALGRFAPAHFAALVRPYNVPSLRMNEEFGLLPDQSIAAAMIEERAFASSS
jgi:GNAT superfamily N-acetyltransferase